MAATVLEARTHAEGNVQTASPVVYINGEMVAKTDARVSIYDHGFLYGDGAFEGIRVYEGNIFRLVPHLERLFRSCRAMHIDLGVTLDSLQSAIVELVRHNQVRAGYIRLSVSRGVGLGLDPRAITGEVTIIISTEQLRLYPQEAYERGLDVITASTRVPPSLTRRSKAWAATSSTPRWKPTGWARARR